MGWRLLQQRRREGAVVAAAMMAMPCGAQLSEQKMEELVTRLPAAAAETVDYDAQIKPILERSCLQCHGPERPKGRFRLDSREEALKGGSNGVDIVPGQSARSPLIFYAARLVEEMEMPPEGKGEPLTAEEIGLLRGWIDQGAAWGAAPGLKMTLIVTPTLQAFEVDGNEGKFREHTGMKEGWNGGSSIYFEEELSKERRLTFSGRTFLNPEDYKFRLQVEQRNLGFVELGFEQYREFYADTGGVHPGFSPALFTVDRDLGLDVGRAWANFGLTLPDRPRVVLGYEYQYRDGAKSTLQWGDAGAVHPINFPSDARKVYPSVKSIDEEVHILKLDVTHEIHGLGIASSTRGEFYEQQTQRRNGEFFEAGSGTLESFATGRERFEHVQASEAIRLEKQVRDWLFVSGGYLFIHHDGEYDLGLQTVSAVPLRFGDKFWFTDSVVLEQNTHVMNANTQLGPWDGLSVYGGLQSEWMSQRGFGDVRLDSWDEFLPGMELAPATVDTDLDRTLVEERLGVRYTKIPFTVLFAEGRLAQESIGQREEMLGASAFLRDTDATSDLADARAGVTVSPWREVSLTAAVKHREKNAEFDHDLDIRPSGAKNQGYSAFITARDTHSDEASLKVTYRPLQWLKASVTYQNIATDYITATEPFPFPAGALSPGGSLFTGNYDADVFGVSVNLRPWQRLTLASSFTYRDTRMRTVRDLSPQAGAYEGDVYTSFSSATVVLNQKTDFITTYSYNWADYRNNGTLTEVTPGLAYDWHAASAALVRRWRENLTTRLQYRFYYYDERNGGGLNNYTAHGIVAALTMVLK